MDKTTSLTMYNGQDGDGEDIYRLQVIENDIFYTGMKVFLQGHFIMATIYCKYILTKGGIYVNNNSELGNGHTI